MVINAHVRVQSIFPLGVFQMPHYDLHTVATAPDKSKSGLGFLMKAFGFVPNIAGVIANSPTLINSLACVFANVHNGTLNEAEIQVLLLTNAVTNSCTWAVAFHTTLALKLGVSEQAVKDIRDGRTPREEKVAALHRYARALIETRGHVPPEVLDMFLRDGFDQEQVLAVIAVSAASTITNYAGTLASPPLESPFDEHAWTAPA